MKSGWRWSRLVSVVGAWGALLSGAEGLPAGEGGAAAPASAGAQQVPVQTPVFVLGNDRSITAGLLEGFDGGYLLLRRENKLVRYSPQDFYGIYLNEDAAREALRRLLQATEAGAAEGQTPGREPGGLLADGDAEFQKALKLAFEKNRNLRPGERLASGAMDATLPLEMRNCLLEPQALLEPEKAVPVFQVALMAAFRPKIREMAEETLRQHMKLVGGSELTGQQKEVVRGRIQKLFRIISGGGTGGGAE